MNAEYLLDAIGQLDDDLVREAERYRRPKVRYGRLMGLAASFAVVIALGYVLIHVGGMGNGAAPNLSGGGNGGAPANGADVPQGGDPGGAPSAEGAGDSGEAAEPSPTGEGAPSSGEDFFDKPLGALPGTVFVRGTQGSGTYILTGEVLEELPEGGSFVLLGQLLALEQDSPPLSTTVEEYVGLDLWAENGEADLLTAVYVGLPEGSFARAELAEP